MSTRAELIKRGVLKPPVRQPAVASLAAIKARKHEARCLTPTDKALAILRAAMTRRYA